jgi:galactan endo-1,6-beta-galactosidase
MRLIVVALLVHLALASMVTVKIDPNVSYGTWRGWGCSLAWWAQALGDREDLATAIFTRQTVTIAGTPVPGLNLNFARYNPGACSWNTLADGRHMAVSPNIGRSRQMDSFWIDPASSDPTSAAWNWSVDANQRNMLKLAKKMGVDTFQLFSNSPVWWMCLNLNPSGSPTGRTDNINASFYQAHAEYLAIVAKRAKDEWNITFESVEAFNEPSSAWWTATGSQEGCHFDASTQAKVIPLLRAELDARGLQDMKIAASDETSFTLALHTWQSLASEAKKLVDFVDVHGYEYLAGPRTELYEAVHGSGKVLLHTEYGEGDASGQTLANNLHLDFHALHPAMWTYWQPFDGGGWGLVSADNPSRSVQGVNAKFFVLAQYTRHINKGCVILGTPDLSTIAAHCHATRTLVLVVHNSISSAVSYVWDLSLFSTASGPASRWETNINAKAHKYTRISDASTTNKQLAVSVPANTVQTLEVHNVDI